VPEYLPPYTSLLHNLLFKAIFGQDYPNLGRLCNMLPYTLELNPVEIQWRMIRKGTGNRLWEYGGDKGVDTYNAG